MAKNRVALGEHFKCCIPLGEPELEGLTGDRIMAYAKVGELMDRMNYHRQSLQEAMRDFTRAAKEFPVTVDFGDDDDSLDQGIPNGQGTEEKE